MTGSMSCERPFGGAILQWSRRLLIFLALGILSQAAAQPDSPLVPPPEPPIAPIIVHPRDLDADASRVSDRLEERLRNIRGALARVRDPKERASLKAQIGEPIKVELVFSRQVTRKQIDDFLAFGGQIEYIYQAVSYGWNAVLPLHSVEALPRAMGDSLVAVIEDQPVQHHLDEATRTGRVRPVWVSGFAGSASGYSGGSNTTVGVIDTGCDDSHTDLSGRMEYWKDWTTDRERDPVDYDGHGTHVTGIAAGTGAVGGTATTSLLYTDSGNMSGIAGGYFYPSPIHIPGGLSVTYTSIATWLGGGTTDLYQLTRANGSTGSYSAFSAAANGSSPLTEINSFTSNSANHYTAGLLQNPSKSVSTYAVVNTVTYAGVGDGFNTFRGVAPGCRWAFCKVFRNSGAGSSTDIGEAIDDMVAQRSTHNIKVVNMSLGIVGDPGINTTLRAKVNTMVNNGIVAVCSAGNDGPGTNPINLIDDPGRAALAITVAANNDANQITKYSSTGFTSPGSDEDYKPDVMAPGGSAYYSLILSADTNDSDAESTSFADQRANDYLNISGTSMAAPFVAGASALVIQALEDHGLVWGFSSSTHPLLVKMLLCATCTESNAVREASAGNDPTLGRAASPKDLCEGYGLVNVDAAIEAASLTYSGALWSDSTAGGYFDRRAWARKIGLVSGTPVTLFLDVPAMGDFDIYIYSGTPDSKGNPVMRSYSTSAGNGVDETISFTPGVTETGYLVIKRVSGSGTWTLSGPDATPPSIPVVTDDGGFTASTNSIHATWSASDPESGVVEYQYAVSSTKIESGIISGGGWQSVGAATQGTRTGLTLSYGQVYYVLVKARNGAGLWSAIGVSDGITAVQNAPSTIGAAKLLADSATVGLAGKTITAVFSDHFYMQESLKSAGIRVTWLESPVGLGVGKLVDVGGRMQTLNGERHINSATCKVWTTTPYEPVFLNNRAVGGDNWNYNQSTGAGQKGIKSARGLNNLGLLITITGRATYVAGSDFWIDDGTGATDNSGHLGIKVSGPGLTIPSSTQYAKVTGISSAFQSGSDLYRLIKATAVQVFP